MKLQFVSIFNKIKKKPKIILGIIIAIVLITIFALKTNAQKTPDLVFANPVTQSISKTINISGHVDAKEKVRLRFIAGGKLTYVGAKEGDLVKKWQTIATIDQATLQKQLEQDLNNYLKERWDWEEVVDENRGQPLTLTERRSQDKDQWDLENTVLNVEIRDIAIKNTDIYAPFEGILTSAPTSVAGMQVLASDYFEVINPQTLVFRAAIDESDIAQINIGQKATLVLDSYENTEISTEVSYISYTSTETSSGTAFVVEFPLTEADFNQILRIGMNGDVRILIEDKENVLTIPAIALIQRDDQYYVLVKSGKNQTKEKAIEIGLETEDLIEVKFGLSESDQVVIPE
jgi:membrane fusion protein, macrolide-specific efflux system